MSLPLQEVRGLTQMLGEINAGVGDNDDVLDRGFDLSEVCLLSSEAPRRYVDGSTRLQGRLNQGCR